MENTKETLPRSFSSPESRERLLSSLQSSVTKKSQQAQEKPVPVEESDEQVYFPGENIPVEYQDDNNMPPANAFMNDHLRRQIDNWEKNYTPDEETPAEDEEEEES